MNETDAMKVLVIGAGVAGLTCAAELHKAGFAVHIVECPTSAPLRQNSVN
ncbi:FAD-dependent oxidoreductase [Ochrobactrum sp. SFR4]|nr:FAD-binding protein [Ochrobactrum sp. SFR4]